MDFDVQVVHSVAEIDPVAWDELGGGRPFSSHRWYRFGETVMADCTPVYLLLACQGEAIARATFWVIRSEPLPIPWEPARGALQALLRRRPLFVCRSPLADTSGLILPASPLRRPALEALVAAALREADRHGASFLLVDFLTAAQVREDWPGSFVPYSFSDPGTRLEIAWSSFDEYLAGLSPKTRKHYRQHMREAEEQGIRIEAHDTVADVEEAVLLVREVERRHRSSPNPWAGRLLENIRLVDGAWLTARMGGRTVGCELILEDNGVQMVTALGLSDVSHVFFQLGYADIRHAIETRAQALRWGSGLYETKRRLGFRLEDNNELVFTGLGALSRLVARGAGRIGK